ncbi:MAG: sulfotransferase family protein [Pseudomonas sp.]|uniref:sulfotransferase family protein n=1 Tax=Pseudomonas sp. TaxID=306 RepID=UPI003BB7CF91
MSPVIKMIKRGLRRLSPPGQALMVVGMHRSGTSFLTGSLQQAGLELGQHSDWNPHNLKGNRENQDVVAFHDALLARHGCAWDLPPGAPIDWSEQDNSRARDLIKDYRGVAHWGFKDPRALLLVEGWQALLPNLQFVGIFRHPKAVAHSLNARGGMSEVQAFLLWQAYNNRLIELHKRNPFPLLCFDEDEHVLSDKLDQLLPELGLQPLAENRFFSAELKHHQPENSDLPAEIAGMYQTLCRLAR